MRKHTETIHVDVNRLLGDELNFENRQRAALITCNHIRVAKAGGHDLDQYFVSARAFQS
jgi:hypothetical protein